MAATVWKFVIPVAEESMVPMPRGAEVLHVGVQGGELCACAWARVDPAAPPERRTFHVRASGHGVQDSWRHRGTVVSAAALALHVFEPGGPS